eukprot:gene2926-3780_t
MARAPPSSGASMMSWARLPYSRRRRSRILVRPRPSPACTSKPTPS